MDQPDPLCLLRSRARACCWKPHTPQRTLHTNEELRMNRRWSCARPPPVHPELFICVECAVRGVGLPAAGAGSASQQAALWVRLVPGADSLASARHRASTLAELINRAVADFVDFCRARGVEPLPAQPEAVRAYVFHCTADRGLDAQTVEGRMPALGG